MNLIESLGKALNEASLEIEYVLLECGQEIGRFATVSEAKQHLQFSWGEGQFLEWTRKVLEDKTRVLVHEQFMIKAVKK